LTDLGKILDGLGIKNYTGAFPEKAPDVFSVLTSIDDTYPLEGDGRPLDEQQEVRISLFCNGDYRAVKRKIERSLLSADMCITGRRLVEREKDTGFFHYAIDVANLYFLEE